MGISYKDAGVDIDKGDEVVSKIKDAVNSTHGPEVLSGLGGFGGFFAPDLSEYQEPVFVSGTDGVGTKLKIAFKSGKHDTVGIDLVAMCVNDILAQGAKPLFFLDYLASGVLDVEEMSQVVSGIANGCKKAGCALIGGETAEMPDFYNKGEYDMAGFTVGLVDKEKIISGEDVKDGDLIIGLGSNGIHSNGFSLVRKVLFDHCDYDLNNIPEGWNHNLEEELLKPTKIYVKSVIKLISEFKINGLAHITGGGLLENLPRILSKDLTASIVEKTWFRPEVFNLIKEKGNIAEKEMYRTFNMGIGFVVVVDPEIAEEVLNKAVELGEKAYLIGKVKKRNKDENDSDYLINTEQVKIS
ncbi:MAG: phosphoribosylformylglycinamidine cyclo-ligase [Bacillota bacterium]